MLGLKATQPIQQKSLDPKLFTGRKQAQKSLQLQTQTTSELEERRCLKRQN